MKGFVTMHSALWWRDFEFQDGVVTVKQTGAQLRLEPGLIGEVLSWFPFYIVMEAWRIKAKAQAKDQPGPSICFVPQRPRPWYLIWSVLHAGGARITNNPADADAVFYFDDNTTPPHAYDSSTSPTINKHCCSIEKSHVAEVFEECFGYSLAVDPMNWNGKMVEKSETNGAHDGRVIEGPCPAVPGKVYQRLIDNTISGDLVEDIRCPSIGGNIPLIIYKRRPRDERFSNSNTAVEIAETSDVLSEQELEQLTRFTTAMQLDWGSMDVLRDRDDGRLYVVDVNKTDMGPPVCMNLDDKIEVTKRLAAAFTDYLGSDAFNSGTHNAGASAA